ncbi:MAG: enoyl-CoA hydratase/isomerase family protein [Deltaproteobacteria bacterium]|nr:enoyl-CoA hydratase/isomerase family protein [Deltaproteobacteria bacterium]
MELPSTVTYERKDHVAIVTIDRPETLNSLTVEMLTGIEDAMRAFQDDDDLWVGILTATGDKAFSSGLDLKEAAPMLTGGDTLGFDDTTKRQFSDVFKPIICAVNGFCIAGGMEMLLGTDLRIASEGASFGLGEVRFGLVPLGGTHIRLPRQIPWAMSMQLLLTGKPISAQRAYEVGLINEVVPPEELMPTALRWAEGLCKNGPLAMRTAKEIAVRGLELESGFVMEKALGARVLNSEDAKEGPAAFAEKRKPRFTGR